MKADILFSVCFQVCGSFGAEAEKPAFNNAVTEKRLEPETGFCAVLTSVAEIVKTAQKAAQKRKKNTKIGLSRFIFLKQMITKCAINVITRGALKNTGFRVLNILMEVCVCKAASCRRRI